MLPLCINLKHLRFGRLVTAPTLRLQQCGTQSFKQTVVKRQSCIHTHLLFYLTLNGNRSRSAQESCRTSFVLARWTQNGYLSISSRQAPGVKGSSSFSNQCMVRGRSLLACTDRITSGLRLWEQPPVQATSGAFLFALLHLQTKSTRIVFLPAVLNYLG